MPSLPCNLSTWNGPHRVGLHIFKLSWSQTTSSKIARFNAFGRFQKALYTIRCTHILRYRFNRRIVLNRMQRLAWAITPRRLFKDSYMLNISYMSGRISKPKFLRSRNRYMLAQFQWVIVGSHRPILDLLYLCFLFIHQFNHTSNENDSWQQVAEIMG